jgi:muramoyltetrapeptide carboxypeptidase
VDFGALAARPRPVLGYSDITALLAAIVRRAGIVAFHAPTARAEMPPFTRRHFARVLTDPTPGKALEPLPAPADVLLPQANRVVTLHGGVAEGPLAGGNLSLLQCLIGSPYFPDLDGALLVLEDVNEDLYRIDRMLAHLRMIGALAQLAGVLVGRFTGLKRHMNDGALGVDDVLDHYFGPLGVPVAIGLPVGHIDDQWTIPLGVRARFDADAGTVSLLEPAVS